MRATLPLLGLSLLQEWRFCQSDANLSLQGGDCLADRRFSGSWRLPLGQGGGSALLSGLPVEEVALGVEVVLNIGVDGGEPLQCHHLAGPEHRPFASPERQVAALGPVVCPAASSSTGLRALTADIDASFERQIPTFLRERGKRT